MQENPGIGSASGRDAPIDSPRLLVEWTPWYRVFANNLADLLLGRRPIQPWITFSPAPFWPDVFVTTGLPWRNLCRSGFYHLFFVVVVWGFSVTWLNRPPVRTHSPFDNSKITYYSVSEYLPEISTGGAPAKRERKGEPAYARQKIISLPPAPDNFRQTIITPSKVKLPPTPMPNIVAWTPVPTPVPESALTHTPSQLEMPAMPVSPIAPPPDVARLDKARMPSLPSPEVIHPAPATGGLQSKSKLPGLPAPEVVQPAPSTDSARLQLPNLPQPAVIEPPVAADAAHRRLGEMSMGHLDVGVSAPKLPVAEQRAVLTASGGQPGGTGHGGGSAAGGAANGAAAAPPPPSTLGLGNGKRQAGQLIALGLDPAAVSGPINVPNGSRSGEFAAGPEGKPGAPGTPEIKGGGTANGGNGTGHAGTGSGSGSINGGPPGISVGPGGTPSTTGAVVAANPGGSPPPPPKPVAKAPLMAALRPSRVADLARATRPGESVTAPDKIEDKVFNGKKYYSMILNMPNLTSAGGSWVMRFAELNISGPQGHLTAPVATLKVDPAYPPEAIRERVEGMVMLYAVIHKDGTVGEVRVLRGIDGRLDENARVALSRWHFRPAMKNGAAVDLEAVVQIPFVAGKLTF